MKSTLQDFIPTSPPVDLHAIAAFDEGAEDWHDGPDEAPKELPATLTEQMRLLRHVYALRRLRSRLLPPELFADPCWDMLIDLYIANLDGRQISVSSACLASCTTPTTGLRHLRTMESLDLVERHRDPSDGRRMFVSLTPVAQAAMQRWIHSALGTADRQDGASVTGALRGGAWI